MIGNTFAFTARIVKSTGHVFMKHAVLYVSRTGALGGLRTYWTRVWMACRAGLATLPCELTQGSYELDL
ncbi:hypothetical protein PVK06_008811 [Gossypium arboreum]|uniref:Uncharacterized protein n=1 Tax=Gossypium arboreum TaxID=29729 RepID=A0ABR0QKW1_GOSAR|nr:hypothetical protein PVK06_008804 [Gossypium arboreum]KAK5839951.1 hypothetical protein PVK06_008811 [Gossypium arboreum]